MRHEQRSADEAGVTGSNEPPDSSPWYTEGLRFTCTQCGDCCRGEPGYVWVDAEERRRLAEVLGSSVDEFERRYTRRAGNRVTLVERANGDCVFWSERDGCRVYEARPTQCRTWPFWSDNIRTKDAWEEVCRECPGAGASTGQWFSVEEIEAAARQTRV